MLNFTELKFGFFCLSHSIAYIHSTQCAQLPSKLKDEVRASRATWAFSTTRDIQQW